MAPSEHTLVTYGEAAHRVAALDIDSLPDGGAPGDVLRHVVVGTVLYEPVLAALRRLGMQHTYTTRR